MSNVKLAIRVRPFTERELRSEKDRIPVVSVVDEHTVTITNIKVNASGAGDSRERTRRYFADYTFDSSCQVNHPAYASQERVFETIGHEVVASIISGRSACVMAYGQSATGKTYTMTGSDSQPGLVPRLCRALAPLPPAHLTVSFLEIYNERVHDLLCEAAPVCHSLPRRRGNARKDLRVREHPTKGPYVQNLRRVAVHDVDSLLSLVIDGTRRRRTAPTRRNLTSSRSHALLELATHNATLHLADLAGSEKASWEGCGGGTQKEGANINKSLVALSNVISALAVSPSFACYGESASTLRWAERARQLPTPKNINLGSNTTSKAVLQAQFNQLISELARNYITYVPETGKISYDAHHWKLQNNGSLPKDVLTSEATIGNIMDILRPKPNANSESTASSVTSGSSDVINTIDKNIKIVDEINKEVDKLFVPTLERTSSSTDLKVVAPLRHKKRQYRSQEVLQLDEASELNPNSATLLSPNSEQGNGKSHKLKTPNVTILHENQRAEIVASVTERLYTKLKNKEEAAASKIETAVEKKIMEPLSELRICTNARQRLMELSQKALRHKRRIGIPAFTQTRRSVLRVKDQGVDVQTDLESYIAKHQNPDSYAFYRDVATETMPMTPRCKEVAVGSKYGTLNLSDSSTSTENKKVVCQNTYVMTDKPVKYERQTQTPVIPPPRRKKRALNIANYLNNDHGHNSEDNVAPVISINISQTYADSESQSSDDNIHSFNEVLKPKTVTTTPDLLTNHCDVDSIENIEKEQATSVEANPAQISDVDCMSNSTDSLESTKQIGEFSDTDDCCLPRISIDTIRKHNQVEMKNIILGRNKNLYPYNIVLSPPKERDTKRIVTFKDSNAAQSFNVTSQGDWNSNKNQSTVQEKHELTSNVDVAIEDIVTDSNETTHSDSTESSKLDTDSFIWKNGTNENKVFGSLRRSNYVPVYKSGSRSKTPRTKLYRDFLGLTNDQNAHTHSLNDEFRNNVSSSDSTEVCNSYKYRPRKDLSSSHDFSRRQKETNRDIFDEVDKRIVESCNDLEKTTRGYEHYLNNYRNTREDNKYGCVRPPSAHLQHLVRLRREFVKAQVNTTD